MEQLNTARVVEIESDPRRDLLSINLGTYTYNIVRAESQTQPGERGAKYEPVLVASAIDTRLPLIDGQSTLPIELR
jgi:hypothetical protein